MPEVKIRAMQLFWLLLIPRTAPAICFSPDLTATAAPQCWRSNIVATAAALLVALVYMALCRRFPHQSLVEFAPRVLGRWPGRAVGLLYVWFFLHVAAIDTRVFTDIFTSTALTETPPLALVILAMCFVIYIARSGLEVLARVGDLAVPLIIAGVLLLILLAAPDFELTRLMPITEGGIRAVIHSALTPFVLLGEVVAVTMLYPCLRDRHHGARALFGAVAAAGLLGLLTSGAVVATFGDARSHQLTFPFLMVVRYIRIGEIIERLESLMLIIWVFTWVIKSGLFLFLAALALAKWLGLPDHRPLTLPMGAMVGGLALAQSRTLPEFLSFFKPEVYFPYAGTFTILIPLLLLALSAGHKPPADERGPAG